jgi:RNA 2',3'-cyclic 3'-phosphodiesterase
MRLFVALYPPADALDHLAGAVERLRLGRAAADGTNVRLTARPLWHITLAFLGEVPDDRAPVAGDALREAATRWSEGAAGRPVLRLAGGGRFGRRRFTVLWVGLAGDVEPLTSLAEVVRRQLKGHRVPYDRKPFRPHLTFARPGDRLPEADLLADVATLDRYEGPDWTVEALHLVRSYQGPKPVHEGIATALLDPNAPSI